MTEIEHPTLRALTDALVATIKPPAGSRPAIYSTLRDAYELGLTDAKPAEPARPPVDAFGRPAELALREGFQLTAVHTVSPEQIAEHGEEVAVTAYVRKVLLDLDANGARAYSDATVAIVRLDAEGVVVVTGEAPV